jgi:uncharacterized protein
VLPNNVFGAYEALAARLWGTSPGTEIPIYVAPQSEVKLKVQGVSDETLTGPDRTIPTRRFDVTFQNPDRPLRAAVVVDNRLRLVRFELIDLGLLVVRDDAASVAVRPSTARNPTDVDVVIPANGFNLAGTITAPPAVAARLRHPVAILVGGTTPSGRDENVSGVAVFAQLARGLADAGIMTVRYDRRASGQSGGRIEAATIADYADDIGAVVKWVAKRDDADKRRIVIVGYGDGAPSALLGASKTKEIDGLVTIGAAGTRGAEATLEQQQRVLDALNLPAQERQARIDLQRKIQAAVTGEGSWEGIPVPVRRQADTPWFRSMLLFDPSQVIAKIKQPIMIVHAEEDASVAPAEAARLAALANARKKMPASEVLRVPGVTHALTATGEKRISDKVISAIADWVKKL